MQIADSVISEPILAQCSVSIPPENCGASKGFMKDFKAFIKPFELPQFLGGIEMEHWAKMG